MNNEEAKIHLQSAKLMLLGADGQPVSDLYYAVEKGIKALETIPKYKDAYNKGFEDCRQAVFEQINCWIGSGEYRYTNATDYLNKRIKALQAVNPQEKTGHCKDCKYFEYDSVAKVDGIPLIVAHEICSRWGDGCKTKEDGYCFLFEPQESENCN